MLRSFSAVDRFVLKVDDNNNFIFFVCTNETKVKQKCLEMNSYFYQFIVLI